jgi:hypothetical protein
MTWTLAGATGETTKFSFVSVGFSVRGGEARRAPCGTSAYGRKVLQNNTMMVPVNHRSIANTGWLSLVWLVSR